MIEKTLHIPGGHKRQHYVPQFLLRFFGCNLDECMVNGKPDPHKVKIWQYSKKTNRLEKKKVENVAFEKYMYSWKEGDKRYTVEYSLGNLEDNANIVIQKILDADSLNLSDNDKDILCRFLAVQLVRTKNSIESIVNLSFKDIRDEPGYQDNVRKILAENVLLAEEKYYKDFNDKSFILIENDTPHPFTISDNPITFKNTLKPNEPVWTNSKGVEIFIPLSPKRGLMLLCPIYKKRFMEMATEIQSGVSRVTNIRRKEIVELADSLIKGSILKYKYANNFDFMQLASAEEFYFSPRNEPAHIDYMFRQFPEAKTSPRFILTKGENQELIIGRAPIFANIPLEQYAHDDYLADTGQLNSSSYLTPEEYHEKVLYEFNRGNHEYALNLCDQAIHDHMLVDNDKTLLSKYLVSKAFLLELLTDYKASKDIYLAAIEAHRRNVRALVGLADLFFKRFNDSVNAETYYDKALAVAPEDDGALGNKAKFCKLNNRLEDAEMLFKEAIKSKHDNAVNVINYAGMKEDSGDYVSARKLYEGYLNINPFEPHILGRLGYLIETQFDEYSKAEEMYEMSILYYPQPASNFAVYGNFLSNVRNDYKKAHEVFEKGLTLYHSDPYLLKSFAVFLETDNPKSAMRIYRRAIRLNPQDPVLVGSYARMLAESTNKKSFAEEMFKKALELDPTNEDNIFNYNLFMELAGSE